MLNHLVPQLIVENRGKNSVENSRMDDRESPGLLSPNRLAPSKSCLTYSEPKCQQRDTLLQVSTFAP
jgi:hypothetical protein